MSGAQLALLSFSRLECLKLPACFSCSTHQQTQLSKISSRDHHLHRYRVENHFNYRPSASFQVTHFFLSCSKPEDRIMLPLAPGSDIQIHVSWGTRLKTRRQYHASTGRLNIFPCCVARVEQSIIEEIGMEIYLFLICTAAYFCHDVQSTIDLSQKLT